MIDAFMQITAVGFDAVQGVVDLGRENPLQVRNFLSSSLPPLHAFCCQQSLVAEHMVPLDWTQMVWNRTANQWESKYCWQHLLLQPTVCLVPGTNDENCN